MLNWDEFTIPGGGGDSTTRENPKAPNGLTHTLTCRPMLRPEAERCARQMATESNTTSQHLKESAVPNTCPMDYGLWTHGMQCHWHLHCSADTPKFRQGKNATTFLKDENVAHKYPSAGNLPFPCQPP